MKNNLLIKTLLISLSSIVLGFVLLLAVYLLPVAPMKANMQKCVDVFRAEGKYPLLIEGYKSTRLDNFTDAIMLLTALYDDTEKSLFDKAVNHYWISYENKNSVDSLVSYLEDDQGKINESEYGRYWHGYLVFLKPLLLLFDYSDIRIFNMIFQGALLLYSVYLLLEKQMKHYILPLLVSVFVLNPMTISFSMQYSSVYYIILIGIIYLLHNKEKFVKDKTKFYMFFLCCGIVTAFLDLLTWPLATCGIFLVFAQIFEEESSSIVKKIFYLCKCVCFWIGGYIGMWGSCWIINGVLTRKDMFGEVLQQILFRTSGNISKDSVQLVTLKEVVRNQFFPILKWPYIILIGCLLVYLVYRILKNRKAICIKKAILQMVPFILICILPFVWYTFTRNHSYLHYTYTWRILMISVFSGLCMLVKVSKSGNNTI